MIHNRNFLTLVLKTIRGLISDLGFAGTISTQEDICNQLRQIIEDNKGGFDLNKLASVTHRNGVVQVVAFSGEARGNQWPATRFI